MYYTTDRQPKKLPKSFREVIQKNKRNLSADEIASRYNLPTAIAEWYVHHRDFFILLREIRDNIVHNGSTIDLVFSTEHGFAVSRQNDPFNGLFDWPVECELPNSLVPLRPALATMVKNTIYACNDFCATLLASISMPDELAPGLKLYSRGINDHEFVVLDESIANAHWDDMY
jgi:hypothetical protein